MKPTSDVRKGSPEPDRVCKSPQAIHPLGPELTIPGIAHKAGGLPTGLDRPVSASDDIMGLR